MKYIIILGLLSICSCTKLNEIEQLQTKPTLIQIEAIYIDGNLDVSKVVLVR